MFNYCFGLLFLLFVTNIEAQNYFLTFNEESGSVIVDSVKVENLSLHITVMLSDAAKLYLSGKSDETKNVQVSGKENTVLAFEKQKTVVSNCVKMNYRDGDLLRITGYSAGNKTVVMTIPRNDTIISFYFSPCVDIDGNHYTVMQIGNQLWMTENLKTTRYRNGDTIPNVTGKEKWCDLQTGAYRNYFDMEKYVSTYGRLYNWYAVNDLRGLAPDGWRIPDVDDWTKMENTLMTGNKEGIGSVLKEKALMPAGYCNPKSGFGNLGSKGYWWLSMDDDVQKAWYVYLLYRQSSVSLTSCDKNHGFSVRCVKDILIKTEK